jgi:hypothetical protein
MKRFQKIQWVAFGLILILGVVGCELFDHENSSGPTAPPTDLSANPQQAMNFSEGSKFGVFKAFGQFGVQVLKGMYLLTYTTKIGTFDIVFSASDTAVLPIGLQPGDEVIDASLQIGTVSDTAPVVQQSGSITIFAMPGSSVSVVVSNIFVVNPVVSTIILVQGGQVVVSDNVENVDENDEGAQFGIYKGIGAFEVYVPTGEYLVTYATKLGVFQIVVRANYGNFFQVALLPGDELWNVSIQKGSIPFGAQVVQRSGEGILFFAMPGSMVVWGNVFIINYWFTPVILVEDGKVVISTVVIVFTESERCKFKPKKHYPHWD